MTILIQFAKPFERGRVKTRLAKAVGDDRALEIHKQLCLIVNKQLRAWMEYVGADSKLWLSVPASNQQDHLLHKQFTDAGLTYDVMQPQQGRDLGERMTHSAKMGLVASDTVLIVGSDFPVLDNAYINEALTALGSCDIVLGASDDGGFGLIGFRDACGIDLYGLDWGTTSALQQTIERAANKSLITHVMPARFDVDLVEDYQRWQTSRWYNGL
jgi:rSAM/selenodomain-associated transferase 1